VTRNRSEPEKIIAHFIKSPRKKIFIDYIFFFTSPHSLYSSTSTSLSRDKNIFKKHLRRFHFLRESEKRNALGPKEADSIFALINFRANSQFKLFKNHAKIQSEI